MNLSILKHSTAVSTTVAHEVKPFDKHAVKEKWQLVSYLVLRATQAASMSAYRFFSVGFPELAPYPE